MEKNNYKEDQNIEDKGYRVIKEKKSLLTPPVLFILFFLSLATFLIANKNLNYHTVDFKVVLKNDTYFQQEFMRFVKNVNRFFCYFDGYNYDSEVDKEISEEEIQVIIDEKKNRLYYEQMLKEEEIFRKYTLYENVYQIEENLIGLGNENYLYNNYEDRNALDPKNFLKRNAELTKLQEEYAEKINNIYNDYNYKKEMELNYYDIKNYLENISTFNYYLVNENKQVIYTNMIDNTFREYRIINGNINENFNIDSYLANSYYYIYLNDYILYNTEFNGEIIANTFKQKGFTGVLSLNYIKDQNILDQYNSFVKGKEVIKEYQIARILSIGIVLFILFIFITDKKILINGFGFFYDYYVKVATFIKLILVIFSSSSLYNYLLNYYSLLKFNNFNYSPSNLENFFSVQNIFAILILSFYFMLLCFSIVYIIKCFKNKSLLKQEKEVKFLKKIIMNLKYINYLESHIIIVVFYLANIFFVIANFCMLLNIIIILNRDVIIFIIYSLIYIFAVCLYYFFIKLIFSLSKLNFLIDRIYNGETEIEIRPTSYIRSSLFKLENVKQGFLDSVNKMIKSEKMKAELITNVSHDLKTPLTSIINYIDLLKSEGLASNNANEYLKVLDQKSQRLKLLIEDLFEASKLSSGNIELEINKINVVDLIRQTIGELQEKINDANIELKLNFTDREIFLNLDGKKIWRVFENLITNIIKYSQSGTRAYINIEEEYSKVVITFRNISKYEINYEVKDLFERFKRGDVSRHTDGNGLGLSIAQSIVLLHKGDMQIFIDGDLFKVIVEFKKQIL